MLMWQTNEELNEDASFVDVVFIINELNVCGGMYLVVAQCYITSYSNIWKRITYSMLMTNYGSSACTTSSCHTSTTVCSSL